MEKAIKIGLIIGIALFLRCCIIHHPYSGENIPPMYGDYEAQRHWQEITINLPMENWYKNTSDNNLEYWGLDYPPLTAYHSYVIGKIANKINPKFIELYKSRGYESNEHKLFMRMSVMISDFFLYIIPMILFYWNIASSVPEKNSKNSEKKLTFCLNNFEKFCITALIYPGIILIDHGHFQYNCVSLGLFLFSCIAINRGNFSIASFFFVLALNYKQMELYHALSFFSYILGKCLFDNREKKSFFSSLKLFLSVSFTVLLTFIVVWAPFWVKNSTVIFDIVERLFPIKRGIFEDKVANVWCLINIFIKLRNYYSNIELAKICLFTTTLSILPSSIDLLEVEDQSDGCGGKFSVLIVSEKFEGKPLLQRHRLVNSILSEELKEIHAFSQKTLTPVQWEKQQDQSKQ
ncbi:hypothetical protein PV328_007395 [Microctonus aethiopoides]|uniref:dolichyl-P-Glc:Man9GlcNAc2-PP-dolichol alpha-1,3-glucosyltransferase n=1 Tax=Microctonus aethiopoides TaxID=144406 RepID=A0AA39C8P0_9HYME|nr:hypothetical protein PV328_007395 [Microctonus aethiopoides]